MQTSTSQRLLAAALLAAFLAPLACTSGGTATTNATAASAAPRDPLAYPPAARDDVREVYHGVEVADPYRWLEDADAEPTRSWVAAQNELVASYLERIPERPAIRQRLEELWNYERFGLPTKEGGRYFLSRNDGLQNQSVLYVLDGRDATPRVLLDPNALSQDGTVALAGASYSEDGKYLAYGIADGGSDWNTWRVRDVASAKDLPDTIRWVKFSGAAWADDGSGFFYSRYDAPQEGAELAQVNYFQKLYFHALGTDQSEDTLVYERRDQKEWSFGGSVTDDGRYLAISIGQGTDPKNRVYYREIREGEAAGAGGVERVVPLLDEFDASYDLVGSDGPLFWFKTDLDAPRGRLIAIDLREPARERWVELVGEARETLQSVNVVGDHFLATYLKDARTLVREFDLKGRALREVELPGIGTASGFGGERDDPETFFAFASFNAPSTVYRYDVSTGKSEVFRPLKLSFDPREITTEQVFYRSKDGTRVPMFLTYRRGIEKDGSNPTLLYGYGGFNVSMTPSFSPARIAWIERGGIYAVANLRGGGEYGEEWHQAGTKLAKQNVFDDFIAAAEFLIEGRWTSTPKLAIQGASNGGLLVGACITQRPELFGAAIPNVGVMDMLRFHKFTIGWGWTSDYGSADVAEEFRALRAYSPYHNLREGTCYPPTLVTTADHDDRVVPGHSFKFAAAMQRSQSCANPVLIRVDVRSGHGAGKPTAKLIDQAADEMAFLVRELGM